MTHNLNKRLRKIEKTANPAGQVVVFTVRSEHRDEDFKRQKEEFVSKGGNPNSLFVSIFDYSKSKKTA